MTDPTCSPAPEAEAYFRGHGMDVTLHLSTSLTPPTPEVLLFPPGTSHAFVCVRFELRGEAGRLDVLSRNPAALRAAAAAFGEAAEQLEAAKAERGES